jgi:hypothetical protein
MMYVMDMDVYDALFIRRLIFFLSPKVSRVLTANGSILLTSDLTRGMRPHRLNLVLQGHPPPPFGSDLTEGCPSRPLGPSTTSYRSRRRSHEVLLLSYGVECPNSFTGSTYRAELGPIPGRDPHHLGRWCGVRRCQIAVVC